LGGQDGRESQIIIVEPPCECQRLLTLVIPVFTRASSGRSASQASLIFQLTLRALRLMGEARAGKPELAPEWWAVSQKRDEYGY
jgi:hypothetical protein